MDIIKRIAEQLGQLDAGCVCVPELKSVLKGCIRILGNKPYNQDVTMEELLRKYKVPIYQAKALWIFRYYGLLNLNPLTFVSSINKNTFRVAFRSAGKNTVAYIGDLLEKEGYIWK